MLFVFKYKSLPIGLNITGFQDLIPDFATLSKLDFDIVGEGDFDVKVYGVSRLGELGESGEVVVKIPNAKLWRYAKRSSAWTIS